MTISAKELRGKPSQIIAMAARGTEIIITVRGRKAARLIPFGSVVTQNSTTDEIFGLWSDRDEKINVDEYVRSVRKGRKF